jgi:hypothetical protein
MDLRGYRICGGILVGISALSLLLGDIFGNLLPITKGFFESSIIIYLGVLGVIFLGASKKKEMTW